MASEGRSNDAIHRSVVRLAERLVARDAELLDVGCGTGNFHQLSRHFARSYTGMDAVRYPDFPSQLSFIEADLNGSRLPVADQAYDLIVAIETIEHLENPRAFIRELV